MQLTALKSNRVVTPTGMKEAIVLISHGKIVDVVGEVAGDELNILDAGDNVIMPGIIDPHVHINEPGRTSWEGFDTATTAAIYGGITMLVDMPLNSSPVTTTAKAYEQKLKAAIGKLHTNCGFWGGIIPGNEKDIESLVEKGVLGFKAFLVHSGIDEFPNVTEEDLRKAMPIIARYNLPLLVHCEIQSELDHRTDQERSYSNYLDSRPKKWENDAIALMIRLCEEFNCRTHIVHLSSAESIEQIAKAKEKGLPLTCETGQHYLYFTAEQIADGDTSFKCAPPIREALNNEKLWRGLKEGIIDFVATDHSPAPPDLKEMESGNFMKAWGGISSLQFSLPVLWTAAKKHGGSIEEVSKWLSVNPAKLPGLENRKGKIQVGYDADLVIWNPEAMFTVNAEMIQHRHKITPYLHENLFGSVEQTYLNGKLVYDKGKFLHLNKGQVIEGKPKH